ncbi:MAG: DUF3108 domain-containing protein [Muribaculaceae bacterium]|nr:DUF3108 domain-containing protein [Muribaculaceae bacterium]
MKRLLFIATLLATLMTAAQTAPAYKPTVESLKYRVMYKWGLINKQAGTVTLTTHDFNDGYFKSTLVGRSATWADKFFTVRDTLMGTIMADRLEPVYYEKIAREGGDFKRDVIVYDRSTPTITGDCQRWRQKKKSTEVIHSTVSITGTGVTLDMLSAFYYMRHLDYPSMKVGQTTTTNIFSGQKKEILKITYQGTRTVDVAGKNYNCYYISFSFTGDNGKKSSDDIFAWISTDCNRIPMMLLGNLTIGSIRCYYEP